MLLFADDSGTFYFSDFLFIECGAFVIADQRSGELGEFGFEPSDEGGD